MKSLSRIPVIAAVAAIVIMSFAPVSLAVNPVPEAVEAAVTIKSLERIHEIFDLPQVKAAIPDEFEAREEDFIAEMGLNYFDLDALRKAGVRTGESAYIAVLSEPVGAVAMFISGNDKTFETMVDNRLAQYALVDQVERGGHKVALTAKRDQAVFKKGNHIVTVWLLETGDNIEILKAVDVFIGDGARSVAAGESYRRVMGKVGKKADFLVYVDSNVYRNSTMSGAPTPMARPQLDDEQLAALYRKLGLEGAASAFAVNFSSGGAVADGYGWMGEDCDVLNWVRVDNDPVPFLQTLAGKPWLLGVNRLKMGTVWESLAPFYEAVKPDTARSLDEQLSEWKEKTGIDWKREFIDQIDGNFGMSVDRVSFMGAELLFFAQVSDEALARETVDKLTAYLKTTTASTSQSPDSKVPPTQFEQQTIGDETFMSIIMPYGELCYGVTRGHFLITASSLTFRKIAAGESDFLAGIDNDIVTSTARKRDGAVFYLDFERLTRDLQQFAAMMGTSAGGILETLSWVRDLAQGSHIEGAGMRYDLALRGKEGMWRQLLTGAIRIHAQKQAAPDLFEKDG